MKKTIASYVSMEVKSDVNSESIREELINGREKLIIGNIYIPPNPSREASTLIFQEFNAETKYRNVCIMEDFNYRNVDLINTAGDHESDDFINITNKDKLVSNMKISGKLGSSDHQEIHFKIKWDIKIPPNQVQVPDFRRVTYEVLRKHLGQVSELRGWEDVAQEGMERSGQPRVVNKVWHQEGGLSKVW